MSLFKQYGGFILALIGIIIILGAIFNWDWLFEYNKLDKLNSSSSINFYWFQEKFGRNASRILLGLMGFTIIVGGLFLQWGIR